jgi:CspA family cold shock protein
MVRAPSRPIPAFIRTPAWEFDGKLDRAQPMPVSESAQSESRCSSVAFGLAKSAFNRHIGFIDFWPDIGPYCLEPCSGARSDFLPDIDDPSRPGVLLRAQLFTCTQTTRTITMINGTVKFYNTQKGFGFIEPSDGTKDVFVHATALERAGMRDLFEGQKVSFDTAEDRRSGKVAVNNISAA